MTDPYVRYEVDAGVATLTLDSPHNRNAISARLTGELRQGLADAAADPAVRAVVLTHTGGTFCAGADLTEASTPPPPETPLATATATVSATGPAPGSATAAATRRAQTIVALLRAILELPKPVVARIDGHVRAGGMGLVGACDLVVAGPACTFALTEARLGLAPSIISLTVLPRLTSRAASRYFLTGEVFDAPEAARLGLVTVATDTVAEVAAATETLLDQLRRGSPQGLAESKALVTAPILAEFDRSADRLAADSARLFDSAEAQEGMRAFLEKRPARWAH